jgi:hypothetical protein
LPAWVAVANIVKIRLTPVSTVCVGR